MSDRYTFVGSSPQQAPAQCLLSGQTTDLVDTGRWIQGYGRVYLSADTIAELATVSGYTPPVDVLVQQAEWYNKGVTDTVQKEYHERLRTLTAEFSAVADRLERATGVAGEAEPELVEGASAESDGDPGLRKADDGDERAAKPARGGKQRGSVQRPSLDDAFVL